MKLNIWQIVRTFNRPLHQRKKEIVCNSGRFLFFCVRDSNESEREQAQFATVRQVDRVCKANCRPLTDGKGYLRSKLFAKSLRQFSHGSKSSAIADDFFFCVRDSNESEREQAQFATVRQVDRVCKANCRPLTDGKGYLRSKLFAKSLRQFSHGSKSSAIADDFFFCVRDSNESEREQAPALPCLLNSPLNRNLF